MIYRGKLLKRFICTEDLFVNWIIADWHINLTSNDLKNNKKFETDTRHTEIRLWKLDEQCLVKIFSTFPKLAKFIVVEIFFPQPETALFQAVIAARRCDPRFSRLLYIYIRGVEFIPQPRAFSQIPRTWRKLSSPASRCDLNFHKVATVSHIYFTYFYW